MGKEANNTNPNSNIKLDESSNDRYNPFEGKNVVICQAVGSNPKNEDCLCKNPPEGMEMISEHHCRNVVESICLAAFANPEEHPELFGK